MSSPSGILQYKERGRTIVNLALYAQAILDLKKRKARVIVSAATPLHPLGQSTTIYAVDSASSTTEAAENSGGVGEADEGGTLQGDMFYKVPNPFSCPPIIRGFCLLTHGKCQVKCVWEKSLENY